MLDSHSMYAHIEPAERRLRAALEDLQEMLYKLDELEDAQTVEALDIVNQGLCTGRASGCGCDWCHRYDPADDVRALG